MEDFLWSAVAFACTIYILDDLVGRLAEHLSKDVK